MTHVWMYLVGPDPGMSFLQHVVNQVHTRLQESSPGPTPEPPGEHISFDFSDFVAVRRPEFSVRVWNPFRSQHRGQRQLIILLVRDWREFSRQDYLVASCALALHESGAVHLVTILMESVEAPATADPWLGRYRLLWESLAKLAVMRPPLGSMSDWYSALGDCVRRSIYETNASPDEAPQPTAGPVSVFFSYSHRDERLRDELGRHLKLLERAGLIKGWHDREIAAGDKWSASIDMHLFTADLVLLLLSSDFFASDYCCEIEVPIALARHNANSARAIPVVLRPVVWKHSPLSFLQALPKDARPVIEWPSTDSAFVNVCEGILNSVLSWRNETRAAKVPHFEELRKFSSRRRMLDVAMPGEVEVGRSVMLVVLLRKLSSPGLRGLFAGDVTYGVEPRDVHSKPVLLRFPIGQADKPESISMTVVLRTPDFDPPEQKRPLTLQPDEDSQPLIFMLAAKRTGTLKAVAEIYQEDKLVTSCPLSTVGQVSQVVKVSSPNIASTTFDEEGAVVPDRVAEISARTQQAFQLLEEQRWMEAKVVLDGALQEFPDEMQLSALRERVASELEKEASDWVVFGDIQLGEETLPETMGAPQASGSVVPPPAASPAQKTLPGAVPSSPLPRSRVPFVLLAGLACLLLALVIYLLSR